MKIILLVADVMFTAIICNFNLKFPGRCRTRVTSMVKIYINKFAIVKTVCK